MKKPDEIYDIIINGQEWRIACYNTKVEHVESSCHRRWYEYVNFNNDCCKTPTHIDGVELSRDEQDELGDKFCEEIHTKILKCAINDDDYYDLEEQDDTAFEVA